jgi:tRNA (cytidine/uridine-2'-O-)-methyltransferase
MFHIALYQPEIPPNTGNIMRLCANTGAKLHLIYPLGFTMDDKKMRRAGLDYQEWVAIQHYESWEVFIAAHQSRRIFACTSKGTDEYSVHEYQKEDLFLFGPETRGLPEEIWKHHQAIRIPMVANSRSLNLSNAAAVILYEALRQHDFSFQD